MFLNLHFYHYPLWSTAGWRGYISDLYQLILLYRSVPPPSGLPCSRVILTLTSPQFNQDTSFHSRDADSGHLCPSIMPSYLALQHLSQWLSITCRLSSYLCMQTSPSISSHLHLPTLIFTQLPTHTLSLIQTKRINLGLEHLYSFKSLSLSKYSSFCLEVPPLLVYLLNLKAAQPSYPPGCILELVRVHLSFVP